MIVFVFLVIIMLCAILYLLTNENFDSLVFKTSTVNDHLDIHVDDLNYTNILQHLENEKGIVINKNSDMLYIDDVFTFLKNPKKPIAFTILPDEKCMLFVKKKDVIQNESLVDFVTSGKTIGYFNDTDLDLLKILFDCSNIRTTPKLKKVKLTTINDEILKNNQINALFVYSSVKNNRFISHIDKDFNIDFLDYNGIDTEKLNFYLPYCKYDNIPLDMYIKNFKDMDATKSVIKISLMMFSYRNLEENTNLVYNLNKINTVFESPELINYFSRYMSFYNTTMFYAKEENKKVLLRKDLEYFSDYEIESNNNLDGFYNSKENTFVCFRNNIDGLPVLLNNTVILKRQKKERENGTYVVVAVNEKGFKLQKRTVVTQVADENPTYDSRYECYNHLNIKSRGLCESAFDAMGEPKKEKMYWDRRCKKDEDCPFYQANTNYMNYRGGCDNGYCEMPLGVQRLAFRTYDENSKPYCHNCKDPAIPQCCVEQNNRQLYPGLVSPDYAFAFDKR